MSDEYPSNARFGWDMLSMANAEIDEMCDLIDKDDEEGAEAVIVRVEERLFHNA